MTAVQMCNADHARALTDRIKVAVEATWQLVAEAYQSRAWSALGYSSWDDYVTREFGTARLRLPREERQEVVTSLRESGLSIRAIAAVTGDSKDTVHRALAPVSDETPADDLQSRMAGGDDLTTEEFRTVCDELVPEVDAAPRINGTDGKTYPSKAPQPKPRRGPLTEDAQRAMLELDRVARRLQRIVDDDRFDRNRDAIHAMWSGPLAQIEAVAAAVVES